MKRIKIEYNRENSFDVYIRGEYKTMCGKEICEILGAFFAVELDTSRVTFPDDKKAIISTDGEN